MSMDGPSLKLPHPVGSHLETIPHGTLAADRLRTVSERLTTGFYDKPDVIDRIAVRVGAEFSTVG